ncbi:MAG: heavy-metal-associated domain-containing protein [Armatimonadota bacterium]
MTQCTVLLPLQDEARPDEAPVGLERLASEETGVTDVSINPVSGLVRVQYDDARTTIETVRELLARHGYPTGQPMANEDAA